MSKKKIITISVLSGIAGLILLTIIVLSAVFRLRATDVVFSGGTPYVLENGERVDLTPDQIISASGLKRGSSSLFLDKDKAQANIEAAFPYIRVNSITLQSAVRVEINVGVREELFYYTTNNVAFFVLDEELKVLRIDDSKPEGLIPIEPKKYLTEKSKAENKDLQQADILNIPTSVKAGQFVGNEFYKNVFKNLYVSFYRYVLVGADSSLNYKLEEGQEVADALANGSLKYADRADIVKFITQVEFFGSTHYSRIILTTNCGVRVDIASPDANLGYKINMCFSIIPTLDTDNEENTKSSSGTIVYDYDNSVRYYYPQQ